LADLAADEAQTLQAIAVLQAGGKGAGLRQRDRVDQPDVDGDPFEEACDLLGIFEPLVVSVRPYKYLTPEQW
jgi:hypothetical protein